MLADVNEMDFSPYTKRAQEIQAKTARRMGYPVTGAISGKFTLFGWQRSSTDNPSEKLIDTRCLGIVPGSPADTLMINIGGQLQVSQQGLPVEPVRSGAWQAEIEVLYMFADYFKVSREQIRGYVTTGGTEGNLAGLWWAREYLKAKFAQRPLLYLSQEAHYSIHKIANILSLDTCIVPTDSLGLMDYNRFRQLVRTHKLKEPQRPVMVCATVGTTQKGAIDDIPTIKQILEEEQVEHTIHADAALLGAVMPITKPFGTKDQWFDWIDTLAISGHKFLGTTSVCGVALTKKDMLESSYQNKDIVVSYVGGIQDTTVSGTRSGKIVMELHHAMRSLDMHSDYTRLKKLIHQCLVNANYLQERLKGLVGSSNVVYHPHQFVVVFPKPVGETAALQLEETFGLMSVGKDQFAICVMASVDEALIHDFLIQYQACFDDSPRARL